MADELNDFLKEFQQPADTVLDNPLETKVDEDNLKRETPIRVKLDEDGYPKNKSTKGAGRRRGG